MKFWTPVIIFLIGLVLVAIQSIKGRRRKSAIRALAARLNFTYVGSRLPEALSLFGTPFNHRISTSNVIDGERSGIRIIAFDCKMGEDSKTTWERTVIAARTGKNVFSTSATEPEFTVEFSGPWAILYRPYKVALKPAGLMPAPELEVILTAIKP